VSRRATPVAQERNPTAPRVPTRRRTHTPIRLPCVNNSVNTVTSVRAFLLLACCADQLVLRYSGLDPVSLQKIRLSVRRCWIGIKAPVGLGTEKALDGNLFTHGSSSKMIDKEFSRADSWSSLMNRVAPFLFLAVGLLVVEPGAAQDDSIAGVWRAREESSSGVFPGVSASDIQTMWLSPSGQYRREIVVEGGDGVNGAGGMIVDSGEYTFVAPQTFQYSRHSWLVCTIGLRTGTADRAKYGDAPV